jgi:hypothetical protein
VNGAGRFEQFRRTAYKDIPAVVEEMRQYWMPTRFKTRASHPGGRGSSHRLRKFWNITGSKKNI